MKSLIEKIQKYVKENKTLVLSATVAVLALILVTVLIFVACSGDGGKSQTDDNEIANDDQTDIGNQPQDDQIIGFVPSDLYEIESGADKNELAITVSNATNVLFLNK